MVALLTGLKIRLLVNRLRSETWVVVGMVIGALLGLSAALLAMLAAIALTTAEPVVAYRVVVVAGSMLVLGWTVVPVLAFGVDETLDPARFVTLPLRARDLVPGLAVAGAVGVPGLATGLVSLSVVGTWSGSPAAAGLAVLCAPLALLTCVLASRAATTLAARALTRRAKELSAVLGVVLFLSVAIAPGLFAGATRGRSFDSGQLDGLVRVLAWSPLGLVWAAPADVANGQVGRGLVRFALAVVVVVALGVAWERLLAGSLERPAPTSGGRTRGAAGRRPLLDRVPDGAGWAVWVRSLRYWRRDPRYAVIVVTSVLAASVPLVAIGLNSSRTALVATGPYVAFLLALSTSNGAGYDGSAFAAHLVAGVPGRADRAGRAAALLTWAGPLVTALAVVGAVLGRRPELVPACVGGALGLLLGGAGASAVIGAYMPYPVVAAGGNPFQTNAGGGLQALLAQLFTMAVALTAGLPGLAGLIGAALRWPWLSWPTLVAGLLAGALALVAGVVVGGRAVDARGPEILAAVRRST